MYSELRLSIKGNCSFIISSKANPLFVLDDPFSEEQVGDFVI